MKGLFTILSTSLTLILAGQQIIDFEEFDVPPESFLNGSSGSGGFASGSVFLPNDYDAGYDSWIGWAISNTTDTLTPGFNNQYSAIAGAGVNNSENYAVSFSSGANTIRLVGDAAGTPVPGFYVTNSTYAYLSMRDGDAFAKKFGGVTGDDPDFFLLTIKAFHDGAMSNDSVDFYLADYRFADNSQDYLVKDWTFVDLSALGAVDSLSFNLTSSDIGQFGMNTPAFFCMDNLHIGQTTYTTPQSVSDHLSISPNPANDYILVRAPDVMSVQCILFDGQGKVVLHRKLNGAVTRIDVNHLPTGWYFVKLYGDERHISRVVVKH